jgi:hypothetical protein
VAGATRFQDRRAKRERQRQETEASARVRNSTLDRSKLSAPDKHDPRYNYSTYQYDYFTGPQCKVYFGDIWVDDIVTIQFNIVQNKEPIYGYASQNFDAVAMGTVLGQGTLTVAFKEVGYLNVIKALLDKQKSHSERARANVEHRLRYNKESEISSNARTTSEYAASINPNFTPSLIRKSETIETVLDNLKGLGVSAAGKTKETDPDLFTGEKGVRDFEDIAEIMEDTIWGDSNGNPFGDKSAQMLRADQFDHNFKFKNGGSTGIKSAHGDRYGDVMNIMVTFGDLNDFRAEHTLYMLNDVHFTGQGMLTTPNGDPIAESYQFFFRDINQSISQTVFNINPIKFNIGTDDPFELARLKDVDTFTELLDRNPAIVTIMLRSKFNDDLWTPVSAEFSATDYLGYAFQSNDAVGRAHALNTYIEEAMQLWYTVKPFNERPERVAIEVLLDGQAGASDMERSHFNYILDRVGDETSLYKVTSPTKDDFTSLNLVRREDFFIPVPPPPPEPELPDVPDNPIPDITDSIVPHTPPGGVSVGESSLDTILGGYNEDLQQQVNESYGEAPLSDSDIVAQDALFAADPIGTERQDFSGSHSLVTGTLTGTVGDHNKRGSNPAIDVRFQNDVTPSPVTGTIYYKKDSKTISIDQGNGVITVIEHQAPTQELLDKGISSRNGIKIQAGDFVGINVDDVGETAPFTGKHAHAFKQQLITDQYGVTRLVDIPDSGNVILREYSELGIRIVNK